MNNTIPYNTTSVLKFVPATSEKTSAKTGKTKSRGNGEGSIFYIESSKRWMAQYTAGRKPDGSLNRKSVYGKTQAEVRKKLDKILSNLSTSHFVENSDATIVDLATQYVERQYQTGSISPGSYARKLGTIKIIQKLPFGTMKIQKVDESLINYSMPELRRYSDSVIKKVTGLVNTVYDYAMGMRIVDRNPFKIKGLIVRPKSLKDTKTVTAFTIEEQRTFVNYLSTHSDPYKNIMMVALYSGMRIGEILALTGKDIDIENKLIHVHRTLTTNEKAEVIVGKTTKTYAGMREVPLLDVLIPIFNRLPSSGFLFTLKNGGLIRPSTINTHFKNICTKAGIRLESVTRTWRGKPHLVEMADVNTHMLRHTFATRCIEAHMDAVTLSRILGHTDIQTTLNTYTDVFNKLKVDEMEKTKDYLNSLQI